jgi:hypothetical protein
MKPSRDGLLPPFQLIEVHPLPLARDAMTA